MGCDTYDHANGTGLLGNPSSSHSAVIVPRPGSPNEYYVFTVDAFGSAGVGLHYSKVDMTLNSGLGDVVASEKNVFLADSVTEKLSSVKEDNGYGVVIHRTDFDEMNAFEVTASGVNTSPVVSYTGHPIAGGFGYCMKPSAQGDKIAAVFFSLDSIYVYSFNKITGHITGTLTIGSTMVAASKYGVEFSPDASRLYVQSYNATDVRQFDLTLGTSAAVSASEVLLGELSTPSLGGALQLGPDGKIYIAKCNSPYLAVIHYPDEPGTLANFEDSAIYLGTGLCQYGLPTFVQSFLNVSFTYEHLCFNDLTQFLIDSADVDSVLWNFGDPASGAQNTSTDFYPTHSFSDTGQFIVMLIAHQDTLVDTTIREIFIYPHQSLDLGDDQLLCDGDSVIFNIGQPYASFLWNDSSTNDTLIIKSDSLVSVTVYGVCDTLSDSVQVHFDFPVDFDLGPDTTVCSSAGAYILNADLQVKAEALWNTGDTVDSIAATASGVYTMTASNLCNTLTDSVQVTFKPLPPDSLLPADTVQCLDQQIVLSHPLISDVSFVWSDSSIAKVYKVDTTETVWLAAFNECGFSADTINIVFNGEIKSELGEDTIICTDDSIVLRATWPGTTYQWNTGDTTDTIWTVHEDMTYLVTVTKGPCEKKMSIRVELNDLACPSIDCSLHYGNVFTPNGDGLNDLFHAWSDCDIHSFQLYIYNRWGQLVHFSPNAAFGWDGYINGEAAPEGTYFFRIEFRDEVVVDADRQTYQGSISLIR